MRKNARYAAPLMAVPISKKRTPAERKTPRNSCSSSRSRKALRPNRRKEREIGLKAIETSAGVRIGVLSYRRVKGKVKLASPLVIPKRPYSVPSERKESLPF